LGLLELENFGAHMLIINHLHLSASGSDAERYSHLEYSDLSKTNCYEVLRVVS